MNWQGLSISYDELERMDYILANCLLERLREHSVTVPNSINSNLTHGVMDNFDWIEDTKSVKGSSHDTIPMIFQN